MYIYCYSWCFSLCRKEEAALESAAAAATDVTTAMMAVKIELEEKKRTNDLLQRALVSEKNYSVETHFKGTRLIGAPSLRARCSRFAPANNFSPFPSPLQTCHVGHTGTPLLRTVFLVPKQTPPPHPQTDFPVLFLVADVYLFTEFDWELYSETLHSVNGR